MDAAVAVSSVQDAAVATSFSDGSQHVETASSSEPGPDTSAAQTGADSSSGAALPQTTSARDETRTSSAGDSDSPLPASPCEFEALKLTRRDVELAGPDGSCLTLENERLDVVGCSEQSVVQLLIDPGTCHYQVVSKEDHVFTDPGGDRYPQGTTCLSHANAGLAVEPCDRGSAAQRFEFVKRGEEVQLQAAGSETNCVSISAQAAALGACAAQDALLSLTEHVVELLDPILDVTPVDVGHANNWDTAGTELPLVQLAAAQGYGYFEEGKYLEQTQANAFIELQLESLVTAQFLVHTNYATPFDGVEWAIYRDGQLTDEYALISSDAWRTVRAGPSFGVDLVAGERTVLRIESLNGLPHRIHRLILTPPLPQTDNLGSTTTIPSEGATIPADAVHDVYRIGALIEDETWWWRAAWTHARLEYAVNMQVAGDYDLNVLYRAQPSDDPVRWGKRIVVDDNYETFRTIEVEGGSEGELGARLSLSAGPHRILLEHPGHDVGEAMIGNVWTSSLELVPAP